MDYYDKAVEVIEPWNSRMIKKKKKIPPILRYTSRYLQYTYLHFHDNSKTNIRPLFCFMNTSSEFEKH